MRFLQLLQKPSFHWPLLKHKPLKQHLTEEMSNSQNPACTPLSKTLSHPEGKPFKRPYKGSTTEPEPCITARFPLPRESLHLSLPWSFSVLQKPYSLVKPQQWPCRLGSRWINVDRSIQLTKECKNLHTEGTIIVQLVSDFLEVLT